MRFGDEKKKIQKNKLIITYKTLWGKGCKIYCHKCIFLKHNIFFLLIFVFTLKIII